MVLVLTDFKNQWKRNSSVIVDLSAIRCNLTAIKAKLNTGTKVMAVLKADAYGHGSIAVAEAIAEEADWFAVNDIEEGIELRDAGMEQPILVFGVPDSDTASLYSSYSLTATISDLAHFGLLPAGTKYHLNFDTGMGRLGFRSDQIKKVMSEMDAHPELMCTGIYSHFATSDNPGSPKVERQLELFKEIRSVFPQNLLTHISNTGASFFYSDIAFDMVRTGIGIYGYPPGETAISELQPALEWHSYLTQVHPVKKGDTVSYGAHWQAPESGYVGVIPVGYEDGLKRALSGKIGFKIGGKVYPQAGTITMNYCMVFLGRKKFSVGEKVILISRSAQTVQNWAEKMGTIPYEIVTSISSKIPRVYKRQS